MGGKDKQMRLREAESAGPGQSATIGPKNQQGRMTRELYDPGEQDRVVNLLSQFVRYECGRTDIALRYPLLRILKEAARIVMLNSFEALFFILFLQRHGWGLDDQIIAKYAERCGELLKSNENVSNETIRRLELFVLLSSYQVKYTLNEDEAETALLACLSKHCRSFRKIYHRWSAAITLQEEKFNISRMNRIPSRLTTNFNILVESILEISPPYNLNKAKEERPPELQSPPPRKIQRQAEPPQPEPPQSHILLESRYSLHNSIVERRESPCPLPKLSVKRSGVDDPPEQSLLMSAVGLRTDNFQIGGELVESEDEGAAGQQGRFEIASRASADEEKEAFLLNASNFLS